MRGSSKVDGREITLVIIPKEIRRQAETRQAQAEVQQSAIRGGCPHRPEQAQHYPGGKEGCKERNNLESRVQR